VIKYEIKVGDNLIFVSLNIDSPNERTKLIYEGNDNSISKFKAFLEDSYGAFGHTIGKVTTPIDLHYAMNNQKQFQARLIEGQGIVTKYDPEIPESAVT
jgi:hypothetical protein